MRYVFIDEAGISANEPMSVVVGLTAHADRQVMFAEAAINEALQGVPLKFREGFKFSAKEVWGDSRFRDDWAMTDRLAFLKNMMSLPRRLGIAISAGMVRRGSSESLDLGLSPEQHDHIMAFMYCVGKADKYIRDNAELNEVATAVAEDVPELKRFLRKLPSALRERPFFFPPDSLIKTQRDNEAGYNTQSGEIRVTRIRHGVHFVEKGDDPLLYLSDAVAFALRRYFSNEKFGDDFMTATLGGLPNKDDYAGPAHAVTFFGRRP